MLDIQMALIRSYLISHNRSTFPAPFAAHTICIRRSRNTSWLGHNNVTIQSFGTTIIQYELWHFRRLAAPGRTTQYHNVILSYFFQYLMSVIFDWQSGRRQMSRKIIFIVNVCVFFSLWRYIAIETL